jgi:hypothetical protein
MSFWRRSKKSSADIDKEWLEEIAPRMEADREERRRILVGQEALVARIASPLFDHDPIGINFEENTDEYRLEAETITLRSSEASNESQLLQIIHQEFVRWFDEAIAGPLTRYEQISSEIWTLLHGSPSQP